MWFTPIHVLSVTPHDAITLIATTVTSRSSRSKAFHCLPLRIYTYLYLQLVSLYKVPLSALVLVFHLDLLVVGNQVCFKHSVYYCHNIT